MCTVRATHSNTAAAAVVHSRPPVAHPAVLRRVSRGAFTHVLLCVEKNGVEVSHVLLAGPVRRAGLDGGANGESATGVRGERRASAEFK